jgi:hypothetical protein
MRIIRSIQNRIYEIRGERVMLDRDLAALYETDNKALNLAVRRNIRRFPSDFMFQPLPAGSPLKRLDNVILTPRIGWTVKDAIFWFTPWP